MNIAARLVASAGPICCNGRMNARFSARLSATATSPIFTGIAVSPRAKKPGARTFTSTKAGSPTA